MIKLGIFFGGKSVEHEISVITMSQAVENLDRTKYEIVPIYISKEGVMYTGDDLLELASYKDLEVLKKRSFKVAVVNNGKQVEVIKNPAPIIGKRVVNTIDVAFPIIHGTNGEWITKDCDFMKFASIDNYLDISFIQTGIDIESITVTQIKKLDN